MVPLHMTLDRCTTGLAHRDPLGQADQRLAVTLALAPTVDERVGTDSDPVVAAQGTEVTG